MNSLKRKRIARGITVEALAELVGVTASAISNWERGIRRPHVRHYRKLASALKVKVDDLIDLVGEPVKA